MDQLKTTGVPSPLIRKLELFAGLDRADRDAIERLSTGARDYRGGEDLVKEGARPDAVLLLTEGWACRYKMLPNGNRQIMAYLLPGDTCDVFNFVIDRMDHSIGALGACKAVAIPHADMQELIAMRPLVARALYRTTLIDSGTLREWLLNIGQREGVARAAHLFTELLLRMGSIGLAANDRFALPLTQTDIADTIGMTPVYVNRMLQAMRADGLITLERRQLTIHEPERLAEMSAFTPDYLHLERAAPPPRFLILPS